jgi:hypothetical protein
MVQIRIHCFFSSRCINYSTRHKIYCKTIMNVGNWLWANYRGLFHRMVGVAKCLILFEGQNRHCYTGFVATY